MPKNRLEDSNLFMIFFYTHDLNWRSDANSVCEKKSIFTREARYKFLILYASFTSI